MPENISIAVTTPCEGCPLGPGKEADLNKVHFSNSGAITYEPVNGSGCGYSLRKADGPQAERVRDNIKACDGPEVYESRAPGLLGKLGLRKTQSADCPALRIDPTSRRQLTEYFEGV